jgi:hypothetical protein
MILLKGKKSKVKDDCLLDLAGVSNVPGFIFGYIHPFKNGNFQCRSFFNVRDENGKEYPNQINIKDDFELGTIRIKRDKLKEDIK